MANKRFSFNQLISDQIDSIHNKVNFEKQMLIFRKDQLSSKTYNSTKFNKDIFNALIKYKVIKNLLSKLLGRETNLDSYEKFIESTNQNRLKRLLNRSTFWKKQLSKISKNEDYKLNNDVVLSLRNVSINFGGLKALDNLSFEVKKGEIFGLIGPNGAGKTTLFNCITQFYKPTTGEIIYRTREGQVINLNDYYVHNIVKKGIVRTFQNLELIADLSLIDNILIAAHRQFNSGLFQHMFNTRKLRLEEKILKAKAEKILKDLNLIHLKDVSPLGLPYGVLKRIELARTLMADAQLIILDEPAAGLNDEETNDLEKLIKRISKEYDVTIFLVEHDMGLVMNICDHICTISFGKKIAFGTPKEIQNNKDVQVAYLGSEVD